MTIKTVVSQKLMAKKVNRSSRPGCNTFKAGTALLPYGEGVRLPAP